ncbi:MAG: RNA polymerase sigma factor RpoD/SigA [Thermoleophilia bacterium]
MEGGILGGPSARALALSDRDELQAFLDRAGSHRLLRAAEEVALARRIEEGDTAALDQLVECNIRLVIAMAMRYRGAGLPLGDVIQEGLLGLVRAAERFDYRRGNKFSSYAVWWIRQSILRAIANQSRLIRLPVNVSDELRRLTAAETALRGEDGLPPDAQVAAHARLPQERLAALRAVRPLERPPASLDGLVGADGDETLGALLADDRAPDLDEDLDREWRVDVVRAALEALPQRERMVMHMRYGLNGRQPATFDEIGRRIGVSRQRARQLEQSARVRLSQDPALRSAGEAA